MEEGTEEEEQGREQGKARRLERPCRVGSIPSISRVVRPIRGLNLTRTSTRSTTLQPSPLLSTSLSFASPKTSKKKRRKNHPMTTVALPFLQPPKLIDEDYEQPDDDELGIGTSSGAGYRGLGGSRPMTIDSLLEEKVAFVPARSKDQEAPMPYKPINVKAPPPSPQVHHAPPASLLVTSSDPCFRLPGAEWTFHCHLLASSREGSSLPRYSSSRSSCIALFSSHPEQHDVAPVSRSRKRS